MTLEEIFAMKTTENGDNAYNTTMNPMLDILFMSEYYGKHLDEIPYIGTSMTAKLFAMMMRDPRFGLGRRELGRRLMLLTEVTPSDVVKAGRFDDLFIGWEQMGEISFAKMCEFLYNEIKSGNELCKKWMPRYSSKNLMLARKIAKQFHMNKQTYGHFIKSDTTENKLSRHRTDEIIFSQVPSLAMIKYFNRFSTGEDTKVRFQKYLEDVRSGKQELKISTTNVYDIYKNRDKIDPDLFFSKIEKISGSWIPVVDSSGSMHDSNDSYGKALAVGHYLAKCSTYAPDTVLSFSSEPALLKLGVENTYTRHGYWRTSEFTRQRLMEKKSQYKRELESMYTGDCSNTDFGAVCAKLKELDSKNAPDWIVVLSDMEMDNGSNQTKDEMMNIFKENGMHTKLVWWSFNNRNKTVPFEHDSYGNVYLSGYSPMLLKYLSVGFDSTMFLNKLINEYAEKIK